MDKPAMIAIVFDSGTGRTEKVAEKIKEGATKVEGTEARLFTSQEAIDALDELDGFDAIIFGSPTYMGSVSAQFKRFMDTTGQKWMEQKWKDKLASGFTNSSGIIGDKSNVVTTLQIFAGQHSMIWVSQGTAPGEQSEDGEMLNRLSSWSGLMTQTEPKAEHPHPADLATAVSFGKRVAEVTRRWVGNAK